MTDLDFLDPESQHTAPGEDGRDISSYQHDGDSTEQDVSSWDTDFMRIHPFTRYLAKPDWWTLLRRFNKQIYRVKRVEDKPWTKLDLDTSANEDLSPEKLQTHLERIYVSLGISIFMLYIHIIRLTSWKEKTRTLIFLSSYIVAWWFDLILTGAFLFLIAIVTYPPTRDFCFPPAPASIIDPKTGKIQPQLATELGSVKSFTGAPERQRGETLEQEALCFYKSITEVRAPLIYKFAIARVPLPNFPSLFIEPFAKIITSW